MATRLQMQGDTALPLRSIDPSTLSEKASKLQRPSESPETLLLQFHVTSDADALLHRLTNVKTMASIQSQIADSAGTRLGSTAYTRVDFYRGSIIVIIAVIGVSSIVLKSQAVRYFSQDVANILNKTYQSATGVKINVSKKTIEKGLDVLGDFSSLVSKIIGVILGLPKLPPKLDGGWAAF